MSNKFGNAPLPVRFEGDTLEEALHDYQTAIIGMFQDAADVGHPIKVHTIRILQEQRKGKTHRDPYTEIFTVVAFIVEDVGATIMAKALGAINLGTKMINQRECEHDYGDGMKCIHCGSIL